MHRWTKYKRRVQSLVSPKILWDKSLQKTFITLIRAPSQAFNYLTLQPNTPKNRIVARAVPIERLLTSADFSLNPPKESRNYFQANSDDVLFAKCVHTTFWSLHSTGFTPSDCNRCHAIKKTTTKVSLTVRSQASPKRRQTYSNWLLIIEVKQPLLRQSIHGWLG